MAFITILGCGCTDALLAAELSRSFEIRVISADEKANGATGFKGSSSIFTNNDRLEYLKHYAEYAKGFFNDPGLDKKVVSLDQARERLKQIKPQPQPSIRKRLQGTWKAYGYKAGKHAASQGRIRFYNRIPGASVEDGSLTIQSRRKVALTFKQQDWRMKLSWQVLLKPDTAFRLTMDDAAILNFRNTEALSGWTTFEAELDLAEQRFNLTIDGTLVKDFIPFESEAREISSLEFTAGRSGLQIDTIHVIGFKKDHTDGTRNLHSRDIPFLIETLIDDDFEESPDIAGWEKSDYDDRNWESVRLPYAHGGERNQGETLYLRKHFTIPKSNRVELSIESLDPSGEVWINERPVYIAHNRHPISLDITRYVNFEQDNIVAIKVDPYKVGETMRHTSSDEHIGWFAGRIHVDCTSGVYIKDVFAITESIGEQAEIKAVVWVMKEESKDSTERELKKLKNFQGMLQIKLFKWFPEESDVPVAQASQAINIRDGKEEQVVVSLKVSDPALWSPESCHLYKLVVEIADKKKKLIDDYVITTGIRTVSQEGGTFRINGKAAMMNGALLFSMPAPLGIIAQWQRCPPGEYIVKDLMQLKAMNANTARMSQHHGPSVSINDPRYAEYGDQLGILFQWATTSWVRTASPWQLDFAGLPQYIRQVRNHPSIVMWQPANHPKFLNMDESMEWFTKVYDTIWQEDQTRLICPTSNLARIGRLRTDDGLRNRKGLVKDFSRVWVAPMLTRGSMDHILSYGRDWSRLEKWPDAKKAQTEQNWSMGNYRVDYLNSKHRAYFDFESEESIGQPNWDLHKGKPQYKVMSYEWKYDKGSIGQYLQTEQWLESQAWQALSAYEAYKKKRWLDYDGLAWCPLRGGGNTATYQKPLIDYYDYAKLSFYAVKMVFQPILACSKNVDLVYGPADSVPIVVMNLGDEKRVNVNVSVKTLSGKVVFKKTFANITLSEGRTFKDLKMTIKKKLKPGYYAFEYVVVRGD